MGSHPAPAGSRRADHDRPWLTARRGSNPADQHSFIVTEELAPTVSLEDFSLNWIKQPPEPKLKRALIAEVARMTGMMHRAGVNHRDCYICHFLLHTDKPVTADDFKLSVIDLHRAQTRAADHRALAQQGSGGAVLFGPGYRPDPTRQAALPQGLFPATAAANPHRGSRAAELARRQGQQTLRPRNSDTGMRSDGGLDTGT